MKKTRSALFIAMLALAAVLALSACGSKNDDNASASSPAASASASSSASAPAAAGETKEITLKATNFEFDQTEIKAKVGDTLKITLKNESGVHGMEIKDLGVNIKNGETATIVLDKAGTYDFNCSVMCGTGHDNMTGQLIVE
ncbi:cupredoxin domain-containing protein [Cohnella sp. GCM10020058]|uniref:cupredoxin domain-containing protein n=1 Tax=Cohnella sp. GCM10020058 TaxID=3317330 RepID=UPI003639658E